MDRFFSKVEKTDSCWIWKGATRDKNGYGNKKYFPFHGLTLIQK